jgi:chromosomal replication initiator protein
MDESTCWDACLKFVREKVSSQNFNTWFKPIKLLAVNENSLEVEVPNKFFQDWLKDHYLPLLTECLSQATGKKFSIRFKLTNKNASTLTHANAQKKSSTTPSPLDEKRFRENNLNHKYTFENFVVGKCNEFAHAACFAVANNLSSKYNPLFIYGGVGLGKTHLLQAIGHRALETKGNIKVCYYSSERFMNELINSIRYEKVDSFRRKFRGVTALLIDDIQFFAGKERTQEEFFHTFNTLYESSRQIIVTSDKFPKDIPGLEERLRTRFEWGLIADIQPPDMETKVAILKKKAEMERIYIPDDIAIYIASISQSNIREMEGYLIRIGAYSSLTGCEITVEMAKEVLKSLINEDDQKVSIDDIQRVVTKHFNINLSDIKSKKKLKNIAFPRQIAMFLSRTLTGASFNEIGNKFGGKDHSTIIHACNKIENLLSNDKSVYATVTKLKKQFKNGY